MSREFDDDYGDGGTSQLDVVLSFLGILLVYVVVLTVAAATQGSGDVRSSYRAKDDGPEVAILSRHHLVFPFEEQWVVKGGKAARIDLSAIARRMGADEPRFGDAAYPDGTEIVLEPAKPDTLTAFSLTLRFPLATPIGADKGPFDLVVDVAGGDQVLSKFGRRVRLFVYARGLEDAIVLVEALQRRRDGVRVVVSSELCQGKWCVSFERQTAGFANDTVFR